MRRTWWLRDLVYLTVFVAVLIGATWLITYSESYFPAMRYYHRILVMMGINITLAVSLNIINGHAGQFSMGHAGFMAVGAYVSAFLTYYHANPYLADLPEGSYRWLMQNLFFLGALLAGGLGAAIAGYLVGLPSLR